MVTASYLPDIEAEIYFLLPEEGGRKGPAFSGYRPQFYYDGNHWDARQDYVGVSEVYPGQTVLAELTFANPQYQVGKLYPGKEFRVCEGRTVVGRGRVKKILNLEESAKEAAARDAKRRG
jgi:elongation factor Tu